MQGEDIKIELLEPRAWFLYAVECLCPGSDWNSTRQRAAARHNIWLTSSKDFSSAQAISTKGESAERRSSSLCHLRSPTPTRIDFHNDGRDNETRPQWKQTCGTPVLAGWSPCLGGVGASMLSVNLKMGTRAFWARSCRTPSEMSIIWVTLLEYIGCEWVFVEARKKNLRQCNCVGIPDVSIRETLQQPKSQSVICLGSIVTLYLFT